MKTTPALMLMLVLFLNTPVIPGADQAPVRPNLLRIIANRLSPLSLDQGIAAKLRWFSSQMKKRGLGDELSTAQPPTSQQQEPGDTKPQISGVYPHLTMWNDESECGTGALVVWQDDLWAVTYAPHQPSGSSDKLYRITFNAIAPDEPAQLIFANSVGGTPANRMIHQESNQLLIGPYLIDADKNIRTIPPSRMFGRLTGNARHLTDPANKVYYATMEEGLYEVDLNSLEVNCLIRDGNANAPPTGVTSKLPGYHGKGLYSSQGRVIYANNGEHGSAAKQDPTVASGALAEWFGIGDWQLVRRNQFTEVTGPGGIEGGSDSDPVWAMGWDAKSLILALLEDQQWHYYRLPKASHSYDGAHGWNTEWPRIREIGETDLLATMHGTFWRFPKTFSRSNSAGIQPRSNYLKVIGDFCRWNDKIVMGCDDSAKAEFLNQRSFKAKQAAPKQSNSNLWFVEPENLDRLGPAIGRGNVWLRDSLEANQTSDPFLFAGYDYRQLRLNHQSDTTIHFTVEVDRQGNNQWQMLREISVEPGAVADLIFDQAETGSWIRLTNRQAAIGVTANFQYRNRDRRTTANHPMFDGIASPEASAATFGLMRSLAYNQLGIVAASNLDGDNSSYYELNQEMKLVPVNKPEVATNLVRSVRQPSRSFQVDPASVLIIEDGKRYRLPRNRRAANASPNGTAEKSLADYLGESLSLHATCTASSIHQDYSASFACDGSLDETSRWISERDDTASIEIDLGKPKSFRSAWIVTGWKRDAQYAASNFDIQIKSGDQWTTIPGGKVRNNHQVEIEITLEQPITTQSLRILAKEPGHFRVYEIALFDRKLEIAEPQIDFGIARVCREVATERDLLNVDGTFYELPARNAQGMAKIRPIATHNLSIHDFCSHGGLLFFTGVDGTTNSDHIFRSADGKAAVWAGVVDDLWKLGKPRGTGGPWFKTAVQANRPSDPYLMTAYDEKLVMLSSSEKATIRLEVDVDGTELWMPYQAFDLKPGQIVEHVFPAGFSAYWVRAISDQPTTATVQFGYR